MAFEYLCSMNFVRDTIVARATAVGKSAISVIRVSGDEAIALVDKCLIKPLSDKPSHTVHLRKLYDSQGLVDEALITIFRDSKSYTGENSVEISCHGSDYIVNRILVALLSQGARMANPGEFTQRAFLNGKLDLAQAEAVADVIAAEHRFAHTQAMHQLRGGYSKDIADLREKLLNFTSLIELELDFGEEDVEFASRDQLRDLVNEIQRRANELHQSFALGNALKQGFTLVLAGRPNAGKSTLFNAMLNEEKAIVSDIAGTTRDAIEDRLHIEGMSLRIIDTAGIREATDVIEREGIARTFQHIEKSGATLYLFDPSSMSAAEVEHDLQQIAQKTERIWSVANKMDVFLGDMGMWNSLVMRLTGHELWSISAQTRTQVQGLIAQLSERFHNELGDFEDQTVVTNARHAQSLWECLQELQIILEGISAKMTGDLLSFHLRSAIASLSAIIGDMPHDEVLGNIFSKFCIGK